MGMANSIPGLTFLVQEQTMNITIALDMATVAVTALGATLSINLE